MLVRYAVTLRYVVYLIDLITDRFQSRRDMISRHMRTHVSGDGSTIGRLIKMVFW